MSKTILKTRNLVGGFLYRNFLKKIFFLRDPEKTHDSMLKMGQFLGRGGVGRGVTSALFNYKNPKLEQTICGIHFKNPIGLAAGFDKDAVLADILPEVGFGFEEAGSVTGEPCAGNPKPRLWRLKKSKSLIVNFGLKSLGCEKVAAKLRGRFLQNGGKSPFKMPVGISVAKTNCAETVGVEAGIRDYVKAFTTLQPYGDYMTINISCPNAFGGQPFNNAGDFDKLMAAITATGIEKPIFIKMPPDLKHEDIDGILKVADKYRVAGFICTNLTKDRKNQRMMSKIVEKDLPEKGGISGKPVEELANELIKYIYGKVGKKYVIIGCGGVFSAEDAYKKIKLGASLIQLITGMIFEGPQLISEINMGLVKLLEKDGFKNIGEAVGEENKQ